MPPVLVTGNPLPASAIRLAADTPSLRSVAALLFTADGRYLMQHRDDEPTVSMAGFWGLFGGWNEPGESFDRAIVRELEEELAFVPAAIDWFTELAYLLPGTDREPVHKAFYAIEVSETDIAGMTQMEGQGKRLLFWQEIGELGNVLPWDACAVILHGQREAIRRGYRSLPAI